MNRGWFVIALIASREEEIRKLAREVCVKRDYSYQCCRFIEGTLGGKQLLLTLSGEGYEHAGQVALLILETHPIEALISSGFCTALSSNLAVGDIALYYSLRNGGRSRPSCILNPDLALIKLASSLPNLGGYLVQPLAGVTLPEDAASYSFGDGSALPEADVFDFESFAVGQVAAERRVPFLCARVISARGLHGATPSNPDDLDQLHRHLADFLSRLIASL
jgi:nucleoside phosphorylase